MFVSLLLNERLFLQSSLVLFFICSHNICSPKQIEVPPLPQNKTISIKFHLIWKLLKFKIKDHAVKTVNFVITKVWVV